MPNDGAKKRGLMLVASFAVGLGAAVLAKKVKSKLPPSDLDVDTSENLSDIAPNGVYYATDRKPILKRGMQRFSSQRGESLSFGCISATSDISAGLKSYVDYAGLSVQEHELIESISNTFKRTGDRRILLFVAGYDMSFEKCLARGLRTAKAAGLPTIVYSWPSFHNSLAYSMDECNAEWTSANLARFLRTLHDRLPDTRVSLLGHSMGCRVVTWALNHLNGEPGFASKKTPFVEHLVLGSPDMDTDTFSTYVPMLGRMTEHTHVLTSSIDLRLKLSTLVHGYKSRLGVFGFHRAHKAPAAIDGVHTIDFTTLDPSFIGHSIPYELVGKIVRNEPIPEGLMAEPSDVYTVSSDEIVVEPV